MAPAATYEATRARVEGYFDRTATRAWEALTSDAPVSRVRATVRAGRDEMRALLLSALPADLAGARVLDAGCGTGALAVELARRGAEVVAVDISPALIGIARRRCPEALAPRIDWRAGDMLDPALGRFDHAVAMDSLIYYAAPDVAGVLGRMAPRLGGSMLLTLAPRTPLLMAMWRLGKLMPRADRAPSMVPHTARGVAAAMRAAGVPGGAAPAAARRLGLLHLRRAGVSPVILRARHLAGLTARMLPFADAASEGLPLPQLLRLSLFQVSVGMASVLLLGTLNRVMIVELSVPAVIVAAMVAIPVLVAPFRAILGFRSDTHRSAIGWKRVPYLWFGTMWQFGGLAIMPMGLVLFSGRQALDVAFAAEIGSGLAFLLTGLGMHMTQTAGLALAADRASDETRPRVVALLYVMFLVGMAVSSLIFGALLRDFSELRLIQVVQAAAVATLVLNLVALWKQESVRPMSRDERAAPRPLFRDAWADFGRGGDAGRLLATVFVGTMAFTMQDVLLEPYGGEILGLSVSSTTLLTAVWSAGALAGFALAARWLARGHDPHRIGARGLLVGLGAFSAVIFAAPLASPALFFAGACAIGLGGGLFGVATLTAAMTMPVGAAAGRGLALGAWGAAQASAAGLAILLGGALRDGVGSLASSGALGAALDAPATGYSVVYHLEIALIFVTLIVLGPLVRLRPSPEAGRPIGLADFPT